MGWVDGVIKHMPFCMTILTQKAHYMRLRIVVVMAMDFLSASAVLTGANNYSPASLELSH